MKLKSIKLGVLACALSVGVSAQSHAAETKAVISNYADIAHAMYSDSLTTAQTLKAAVDQLIAKPTQANLKAARAAWVDARVPYQ